MKIHLIRLYATVEEIEITEDDSNTIDAISNRPHATPVEVGYEIRTYQPFSERPAKEQADFKAAGWEPEKGRLRQCSGWASPYRRDLSRQSLNQNWEERLARLQRKP